jgi:DNA-binding CsgD family transcriptional regulator
LLLPVKRKLLVRQFEIEQAKVARLTDKQRQCLDLVVLRKSSKEIARQLGISKPTVDQRIASARQILGARNRDEAAIMYAQAIKSYDRVIYDPAYVSLFELTNQVSTSEAQHDIGMKLEEAAIPFSGVLEHQAFVAPGFRWSQPEEINRTKRLLIIVGITVGILSILLIGLSVAQSLSGLLTAP